MNSQHPKSTCCRAHIIRYGGKRRQCTTCRRTWSIRIARRGRKRLRVSQGLIDSYFARDVANIRALARQHHWGRDRAQRMLSRSLDLFLHTHRHDWQTLLPPHGDLILIADALWHRVNGQRVTVYVLFLRPVHEERAVICPPVFVLSHENRSGWEEAFATLPLSILSRIQAMVCDGHMALIAIGRRQKWEIQRCHFHLIANLQMYLGSRRHPKAIALLSLVRTLITTPLPSRMRITLTQIRHTRLQTPSRGIRRILSGLESHHHDYRTYLRLPHLSLPTTTNGAESCMSGLRSILHQCRGFRGVEAMHRWLTGYIVWKQTIRCSGKHQQN
jgi:hypothetical protein